MANTITELAPRLEPFLLNMIKNSPASAALLLNKIILIPSGTATPSVYPKTAAGLADAITASASADRIYIPNGTIGGNHTNKAGVEIQGWGENTKLSGTITNNGIITDVNITGTLTNNGVVRDSIAGTQRIIYDDASGNGIVYETSDDRLDLNSPDVVVGTTENAVFAGTRPGTNDVFFAIHGDGGLSPDPIIVYGVYDFGAAGFKTHGFIGTKNDYPFHIRVNNQSRVMVDNNGPHLSPQSVNGVGTEADPYTTADGTAGIQGAIDDLAARRGGKVLLQAGRYNISAAGGITITTPSIHLVGVAGGFNIDPHGIFEGISGTKLRFTGDGIKLGSGSGRIGGIKLEDLYLWGAVTGTKSAIAVVGNQGVDQLNASFVRIGGNWSYGLYLDNENLDACHFYSWAVLGITGDAIHFAANASTNPLACKFVSCEIDDNGGYGFYDNSSKATNIGIRLVGCSFMRNGYLLSSNKANIYWGSSKGVIEGCFIWRSGQNLDAGTTTADVDGIIVDGDRNVINGNQILESSGWGLRIKGDYNVIYGNTFDSNTDGDIIVEAGATGNIIIQPGGISITDNGTGTIIITEGGDVATDEIWDAKGDLAVGTGADTASRLAVGADGYILSADSGQATGIKWIEAPAGEILIEDGSSAPPVMLTNEAEDDFLYEG